MKMGETPDVSAGFAGMVRADEKKEPRHEGAPFTMAGIILLTN